MKLLLCFYRLLVPVAQSWKVLKAPISLIPVIIIASASEVSGLENDRNPVLPPVAICKNISVRLSADGTVAITGSDVDAGSYDPDGTIANLAVTPGIFNCSQIGSNSVTLTVTDNEGLTSACTATVTVEDMIPPVMICRNHTVYIDASGNAALSPAELNNGSSDNCGAGLNLYLSRTGFTCSDIGAPATITLIGTDASGNSSSCTSQITVIDTVSPVINVKPFEVVLGSSGTASIVPSDIDNGTYDNCGPVTLTVSQTTFSCSDLGKKTVTLTALDSHGNSSSRNITISVSTTLKIAGMSLSSCDLSPTLALFEADAEGGNGSFSYLWKGLNTGSQPFMVIIPFPPSLQFSNTTILETPFFNNTMATGFYDIRLVVTDGNGCTDSSEIKIYKSGAVFNNQTMRYSEACEGEIKTYSVNYEPDAIYDWSVTNGTILNSNPDTSRVSVRWNLGVVQGRIITTVHEPNILFAGGQCESSVIDTVTIIPIPTPVFNNPLTTACSGSESTYTLTGTYAYQNWMVTGGVITAGGKMEDNYITVKWGSIPAGSIAVSVGNNSSCTGSVVINVTVLNLSGTITSLSDITCNGGSDGSVNVAATTGSGTAPYVYSLDGAAFQPGGTFTGVSAGNHSVRIRDALLCTFDLPFIINQPEPLSVMVSSQTDVICFGESNGSVTVTSTGGVAPYQYRINGGGLQSSNIFSGLSSGSYTITVQDSHGCTADVPCTITQPASAFSGTVSVLNVLCFGETTGAINLTIAGGAVPYSFVWNNGAVTEDIENISAGNYSVTVTDSHGCTTIISAVVGQPAAALTGIIISQTDVSVYGGNDGSVIVSGSGGTPPYQYSIDGVIFQASGTFGSLSAGTYTIAVSDLNMCSSNITVTVTQPVIPLTANITSRNDVLCFGSENGSVTVAGWGGTLPYAYSINGGTYQTSGEFGSLSEGTYTVTVRDAALDLYDVSFTITEPEALEIAVSGEDVHCYGGSTGSVTAMATGGTGIYSYEWNTVPVQITQTAINLTSGTYSVMVTDANGCTSSKEVTISQPPVDMVISVSQVNNLCAGGTTGSATAVVTGGLLPYVYMWNSMPEQTKETATDLPAGNYTVTVTDSYGCIRTRTVIITEPQAVSVQASITDASCPDSNDGSINITISGGTTPYDIFWSDGVTAQNRSGLASGTYSAIVTDKNNCTGSVIAEVESTLSFNCLVIPQIITPNNDGFNDEWRIKNIDLYPDAEVRVFNRWGKLIFGTKNLSDNPWDGRTDGKLVPTDSYHYILYLNDGSEPRSGVISVIR